MIYRAIMSLPLLSLLLGWRPSPIHLHSIWGAGLRHNEMQQQRLGDRFLAYEPSCLVEVIDILQGPSQKSLPGASPAASPHWTCQVPSPWHLSFCYLSLLAHPISSILSKLVQAQECHVNTTYVHLQLEGVLCPQGDSLDPSYHPQSVFNISLPSDLPVTCSIIWGSAVLRPWWPSIPAHLLPSASGLRSPEMSTLVGTTHGLGTTPTLRLSAPCLV